MTAWFRSGLEDKKHREISCLYCQGIKFLFWNFPLKLFPVCRSQVSCVDQLPSLIHHPRSFVEWQGTRAEDLEPACFCHLNCGKSETVSTDCCSSTRFCFILKAPLDLRAILFRKIPVLGWVGWALRVIKQKHKVSSSLYISPNTTFLFLLTMFSWDTLMLVLLCLLLCWGWGSLFYKVFKRAEGKHLYPKYPENHSSALCWMRTK